MTYLIIIIIIIWKKKKSSCSLSWWGCIHYLQLVLEVLLVKLRLHGICSVAWIWFIQKGMKLGAQLLSTLWRSPARDAWGSLKNFSREGRYFTPSHIFSMLQHLQIVNVTVCALRWDHWKWYSSLCCHKGIWYQAQECHKSQALQPFTIFHLISCSSEVCPRCT